MTLLSTARRLRASHEKASSIVKDRNDHECEHADIHYNVADVQRAFLGNLLLILRSNGYGLRT